MLVFFDEMDVTFMQFLIDGLECGGADILKVIKFVSILLDIIFKLVPIFLILMISFDLAKNVMSAKEDDMNKSVQLSIKRLIMTVGLFLVPVIVQFTIGLLGEFGVDYASCIDIAITDDNLDQYRIEFSDDFEPVPVDLSPGTVVAVSSSQASYSAKDATKYLDSLEEMSKKVQEDAKNGNKWLYSNDNTKNNFNEADKSTKATNCALYAVWGLIDIGILDNGDRFYKAYQNGENYISYTSGTEKKIKEKMQFIETDNKTAKQLIKDGTLKAGDIVLWYDHQHTNVYAGDNKWYDAGRRFDINGSGTMNNFHFSTLGPFDIESYWYGEGVWKILRIK